MSINKMEKELKPVFPEGWGIVTQELEQKRKRAKTFEDILKDTHDSYPLQHYANIQVWIDRNIEYHKNANEEYGRTNGEFTPLETILEKGVGNCEDGTALMAVFGEHFGYTVYGLSVNPANNGESGHIVCAYKDSETGKWGSAGKTIADFLPPLTDTLDELAEGVAFSNNWTHAKARRIKLDVGSLRFGQKNLKYELGKVRDINLAQKYGLLLGKLETKEGELEATMDGTAYRIYFRGLIAPPESTGLRGVIKSISIRRWPDKKYNIEIDTKIDEVHLDRIFIELKKKKGKLHVDEVSIHRHDDTKLALSDGDCENLLAPTNRFYRTSEDKRMNKNQIETYTALTNAISQILCVPAIEKRWLKNRKILREKRRVLDLARTGKNIEIYKPKPGNGLHYEAE